MTSAMTRLYNFMHYGRSAVLAAMVGASIAAPLVVLALAALGARRWAAGGRHA